MVWRDAPGLIPEHARNGCKENESDPVATHERGVAFRDEELPKQLMRLVALGDKKASIWSQLARREAFYTYASLVIS